MKNSGKEKIKNKMWLDMMEKGKMEVEDEQKVYQKSKEAAVDFSLTPEKWNRREEERNR